MDRLIKKWGTAKKMVPAPQLYQKQNNSKYGILFFGTSQYSSEEAMDMLKAEGIVVDGLRLRAFPFSKEVEAFVSSHDKVFVIEQNRDAQMRSLMMIEMNADPNKLIPVLNYDGMPITANNIAGQIRKGLSATKALSAGIAVSARSNGPKAEAVAKKKAAPKKAAKKVANKKKKVVKKVAKKKAAKKVTPKKKVVKASKKKQSKKTVAKKKVAAKKPVARKKTLKKSVKKVSKKSARKTTSKKKR
jgi:hypothetical protein